MKHLAKQKKSRDKLANAVRGYMSLRKGDGHYTDTVRCKDAQGRGVVVFLTLDIISEEGL